MQDNRVPYRPIIQSSHIAYWRTNSSWHRGFYLTTVGYGFRSKPFDEMFADVARCSWCARCRIILHQAIELAFLSQEVLHEGVLSVAIFELWQIAVADLKIAIRSVMKWRESAIPFKGKEESISHFFSIFTTVRPSWLLAWQMNAWAAQWQRG